MNDKGIKTAYFMGADYQAGWEKIDGAIRTYKGKTVGKVFTPLTQLDFSAEIAQVRNANPDALFIFYPGGLGIAFLKQWQQAGLQGKIPLYSEDATANDMSFPALGDASLGILQIGSWSYEVHNPANDAFVAAFIKKYGRRPTVFSALQFDAVNLIDSAVAAVHGKIEDKKAFWAALHKADFQSVRGPFSFSNNNYPVVSIYTTVVEKDKDGKLYQKLVGTAAKDWVDLYHDQCPLKWLMLDELKFAGEPVMVTGGGSGIGQACCVALAELGASVAIVGRTEARLRETEALVRAKGADAMVHVADVSDEAQVAALARRGRAALGAAPRPRQQCRRQFRQVARRAFDREMARHRRASISTACSSCAAPSSRCC